MEMTCAICHSGLSDESDEPKPKKAKLNPKKKDDSICCTPCGHLFHRSCLTKWLKLPFGMKSGNRYGTCPTCRKNINERQLYPVFLPTLASNTDNDDKITSIPSSSASATTTSTSSSSLPLPVSPLPYFPTFNGTTTSGGKLGGGIKPAKIACNKAECKDLELRFNILQTEFNDLKTKFEEEKEASDINQALFNSLATAPVPIANSGNLGASDSESDDDYSSCDSDVGFDD